MRDVGGVRFAAALLLLICTRAAAEEQPLFLPSRDVSVTYRLTGGGHPAPRQAQLYFSAAGQLMRLDEAGQQGYAVIDRANHTVMVVLPDRKKYGTLPFDDEMATGFILNERMQFSRTGEDTIAGLPCTTWSVKSERATGTACITADGVMLRANGISAQGSLAGLEAQSVTYGPQPQTLFTAPADFEKLPDAPPPAPPPAAPPGPPPGVKP